MKQNEALISYLLNHFSMHESRATLMVALIFSYIKVGSVQQFKAAQGIKTKAKVNSITRRIQRFFAEQLLCLDKAAVLIFQFFAWEEKIVFTLDRTNWQFGKIDINILTLAAIYKGYSIPLCWALLPHKGNSNISDRVTIIERLLAFVPLERIECLLADREFIGREWFHYLHSQGVKFCIRIKENTLVFSARKNRQIKLRKFLRYLSAGQVREMETVIHGMALYLSCTRIGTGELLILATDHKRADSFEIYSQRWTIETMFKSLKSLGFNFEDTHQKDLDRVAKIMLLLAIGYAWSIRVGDIKSNIKPIAIKNHKRPEFSLFSYGFRVIQTILLRDFNNVTKLVQLIVAIVLNTPLSKRLKNVTVVY